jgi:predicted RNase H-like HicB family nuclease
MKTKKVTAIIEASSTGFGVYSDDLPGVTGYGDSIEEAKEDIISSINDILESHREDKTIPPAFFNNGNIAFAYRYDIASIFKYFGVLDASALAKRIGMNASLLRQYKTGKAFASDKQKKKIEDGLHALGRELLSIHL